MDQSGDSDETDSEDHMDVSQRSGRIREKRGNSFEKVGTKKFKKMMNKSEGRSVKTGIEVDEFKVILRFSEEKGVHDMSPVKLTTILKNQVGEVRLAKVLRD